MITKKQIIATVQGVVQRMSYWAWKNVLDSRYTHQEVADWLFAYHGKYREKTLSEWVREKRSSLNPSHHDGAAPAPSVDGVVGSLNQEEK